MTIKMGPRWVAAARTTTTHLRATTGALRTVNEQYSASKPIPTPRPGKRKSWSDQAGTPRHRGLAAASAGSLRLSSLNTFHSQASGHSPGHFLFRCPRFRALGERWTARLALPSRLLIRCRLPGCLGVALASLGLAKNVYRQPEQIDSTIKQGSHRITQNLTRRRFEQHGVFLIFVSNSAYQAGRRSRPQWRSRNNATKMLRIRTRTAEFLVFQE